MAEIQNEIDEELYLTGFMLGEAIFQFGNSELLAALNETAHFAPAKAKAGNMAQIINGALSSLTAIQNNQHQRDKIYEALKSDVLCQIQAGDLIPYGFQEPRQLKDLPIKIPADLFLSGQLNWENSELKNKNFEFSGIRLISNLIPAIDHDDNKSNKPKKKGFADLDPELHIDEKRAAEYLGISPKTLQGYRVKGGGPEYRKIGERSVRYKVADLIKWAESKKRRNTSEAN